MEKNTKEIEKVCKKKYENFLLLKYLYKVYEIQSYMNKIKKYLCIEKIARIKTNRLGRSWFVLEDNKATKKNCYKLCSILYKQDTTLKNYLKEYKKIYQIVCKTLTLKNYLKEYKNKYQIACKAKKKFINFLMAEKEVDLSILLSINIDKINKYTDTFF